MASKDVTRMLSAFLNKPSIDVKEPWHSKRFGEAGRRFQDAYSQSVVSEQQQYGYDVQNISRFESRIRNKLNNYAASGDIYDEDKIQELKNSINKIYDTDSSRFPELISEFSDERDSILGVINNYSTKNKSKDALMGSIEPTKQKLYGIAEILSERSIEELTPNDRVKFRQNVYDAMEDVAKLDKIMADPYYAGMPGWADVIEDVKYGISDASKQLITQIDTWQKSTPEDKSSMYVINDQELKGIERAIFDNNPVGIAAVNDQITKDKTARMEQYVKDYDTHLKSYNTVMSFAGTTTYKDMQKKRTEAYNKLDENERRDADNDPMYWYEFPDVGLEGMPEEGVNLQRIDAQKIQLKDKAETIDADFRNEHISGASIAEILNKPLPWAKGRDKKKKITSPDQLKSTIEGILKTKVPPPRGAVDYEAPTAEEVDYTGETVERNNPGNLRFANQTEAVDKDEQGFAVFPSVEKGWDALYRQIELDKGRDLTLDQFVNKYAPPSENDTTAYLKSLQKQLNTSKNTDINKLDTKELAISIAKQEGFSGKFPELDDPPPTEKTRVAIAKPLTKVKDGKTVVNYGAANYSIFKNQQKNLQNIASEKYNTKENRKKYSNVRNFVKAKFEEWLRKTGKYGKGYAAGDFKYFIVTKVDRNNKVNSNKNMNIYNLYKQGVWTGAEKGKDVRAFIKPNIKDGGYTKFAKDFDEFRKYLQKV